MIWGAVLGARSLFLHPTSVSAGLGRSGRFRRLPCNTRRNCVSRLGTWNVRGINDNTKREEVVDIFKKVRIACIDGDEIEREESGIMVWS